VKFVAERLVRAVDPGDLDADEKIHSYPISNLRFQIISNLKFQV